MRNIILTITLSLALLSTATAGLKDNVIAIYHFEDEKDSGPQKLHGLLSDRATIIEDGRIGKCLQLKKDSFFGVSTEAPIPQIVSEHSTMCWIKMKKRSVYNEKHNKDLMVISIVGHHTEFDTTTGWIHLGIATPKELNGIQQDENESFQYVFIENTDLTDNKWHHIAYIKDRYTHKLYIDGKVVKEEQYPQNIAFYGGNTTRIFMSNRDNLTSTVIYIDEAAFFNKALSAKEIKSIYNTNLTDLLKQHP